MENKNNYKVIIPNILTITRIILTPIIIVLGILGQIKIIIALAIFAAITDLFDGKLARHWHTTSLTGAKLDTVADKVFAIGLIACLINKFSILIIPLLLEIILGLCNLYFHIKSKKTESLYIGKVKTWFLFISAILGITAIFHPSIYNLLRGFTYATINLQILSLISYSYNFFKNINKKHLTIEDDPIHEKIMHEQIEENFEKTIILNELHELTKKYDIYDYEKEENN